MTRTISTDEQRMKQRNKYYETYPIGFKRRRNAEQTQKQRAAQRRYDQKRQHDPARKLQKQVRMFLNGTRKQGAELVGCSRDELHRHLVNTLDDPNTLRWKISFCKPPREFDLSQPTAQKLCFHYSNLIAVPTVR